MGGIEHSQLFQDENYLSAPREFQGYSMVELGLVFLNPSNETIYGLSFVLHAIRGWSELSMLRESSKF